jgi:hypothetical protein
MEVIETNFFELMKKYEESDNFDKIIEFHNEFLNRTIEDLFLNDVEILSQLNKMLVLFHSFNLFIIKEVDEILIA